ncbi:Mlr4903 protein [alpha proteobacterium U9-1i]|nr:Mlr4903 protein [alpha proteobacterium U9-1i]
MWQTFKPLTLALMLLALGNMNAFADTVAQRAAALAPHMRVSLPAGDGPFPVVMMFHGCGGPRPMFNEWARALNEAGIAAINVDSYAPRGISRVGALTTVCTGARLRGRERAGDVYATYAWARAQTWANPQRITAAGWSHGGWTILDALALRSGAEMQRATGLSDLPEEPLADLAGAFFVYPYAGPPSLAGRREWRISPRGAAIIGGRDLIAGSDWPTRALERQIARGAIIDITRFDNATHAFDDYGAWHPVVRYDADDTARAHALLTGFVAGLP